MRTSCLLGAMLLLTGLAWAQTVNYDFEQGTELSAYPLLKTSKVQAEIVPGGLSGKGYCLKISNSAPDRYCTVNLSGLGSLSRNLVLSFEHRETIEAGKEANYLGVILTCGGQQYWGSDAFGDQWRHFEIPLAKLGPTTGGTLELGQALENIQLYGRVKGDTPARMTVWLDNVRLESRELPGKLSDKMRLSYANPPFFNWPAPAGKWRLEYSRDPQFPRRQTTVVADGRNYHLPSQPLQPGTWYWRVAYEGGLLSGQSDTERLEIVPEAHRFRSPVVPVATVARKPHPRIIPLNPGDGKTREDLIRQFDGQVRSGVPDAPPAYTPGNPEWPTWIDWYGKVAGNITAGTGRRLQLMAEQYARTRDPRLRDALKPLVFKAAAWDPEGGSAMKNGDIGAHHLLRGLVWCYDALYPDLTAAERAPLQDAIIARAEQFWKNLNPFRIGHAEFNNHSWLQALGLAEAGLALQGERPEVAEWAEYVRQLYQGLFLSGLGYQGDNNEGIAYWGYGLMFVIDYADMMRHVCGIDFYQHPWLHQTARFPLYSAPPGGWAVSFADTGQPNHGVRGPAQTAQVARLATRTQDPYALWYSGAKGPVEGLMPRPPVELPPSIHYRFIGWSLLNTSLVDGREGVTFGLRSGKFWAGHQHEDLNSFVLHAYGEKLAVDSGHYDWFGSPHFTKYSVLTRAHNALLVNGQDQGSRQAGADGEITAWHDSPAYGYVVGKVADPDVYQGLLKSWERRALFLKPGIVVLHDAVQAQADQATYDWLLHVLADPKMDRATQSFRVQSGAASLRGRFLLPRDLKLEVTKGYPVEPVDRYSTRPVPPERYVWEWTLTARPQSGRGAQDFLTVLQAERGAGAATGASSENVPCPGGVAARITAGGQTHLAVFRRPGGQGVLTAGKLQTDGQAAAVMLDSRGNVLRLCLLGGTVLRYANQPLVATGGVPADLSLLSTPEGTLCEANLSAATKLNLPVAGLRTAALVDGQLVKERKGQAGVLPISLEAGPHQLAWGVRPAEVPSHPLPPLQLGTAQLDGYAQRQSDGLLCAWWGVLPAPRLDRYELGWQAEPGPGEVRLNLDGRPLTLPPGGKSLPLWLSAGDHFVTLTGQRRVTRLNLRGLGVQTAPALPQPQDFRPAEGSLLLEAEKPAAEGEVKGLIVEKVGASGKLAHCTWDTDGQWAEWAFRVAEGGTYSLLVRGCSEQSEIVRGLLLDGRPLSPEVAICRFGSTGGWARASDDWRYFLVADTQGRPVAVKLAPGAHRLRLERLTGSMNLDVLAWQRTR